MAIENGHPKLENSLSMAIFTVYVKLQEGISMNNMDSSGLATLSVKPSNDWLTVMLTRPRMAMC